MLKLNRFFQAKAPPADPIRDLYLRLVAVARDPAWYHAGVPDTIDGRFDVLSSVVAAALLRLEDEGDKAGQAGVRLTEVFIDNMDSELRQLGTGDMVVGKNIGRLVSQLGGRLGAYRDAWAGRAPLGPAIARNMLRDEAAGPERTGPLEAQLNALRERLARADLSALLEGRLP